MDIVLHEQARKRLKIIKTSLNTDTTGVHEQCIRTDKAVGQIFSNYYTPPRGWVTNIYSSV